MAMETALSELRNGSRLDGLIAPFSRTCDVVGFGEYDDRERYFRDTKSPTKST